MDHSLIFCGEQISDAKLLKYSSPLTVFIFVISRVKMSSSILPGKTDSFLLKFRYSQTSGVHSSNNFKNKQLVKRNYFLCHTQIYSKILFHHNFSELFIPFFNLAKILIFLQKRKLQELVALSVLKINH